jgi:ribosomal subunit interface protein
MKFPIINFKYNNLKEAAVLSDLVEQKMQTLTKFLNESKSITCDVEFEKVAPHKTGQVHRVEVNMMIDGTLFRAESTEDSFEMAVDEVRNELDKELRRAKDKQVSHHKQAGRVAKEQMLDKATLETVDTD